MTKRGRKFFWGWLILAAVLMVGCATPPPPPAHFYRIYAQEVDSAPPTPHLAGVLVVRRFLADGLVSERPVVYGEGNGPNPLKQYHYHSWTESPTRMLQEQLVPYLRAANVATKIITPEVRSDPRYELTGKIRRLEQIRDANTHVVVELEFALTEPRDGRILWVQSYLAEVDCADDGIVAAVDAFNEAVTQVFARLVADLWKV